MTNLVKYNAARTALAEAHAIDEVKDIRDKSEAMAAYARQAKDTELLKWVTEIKVRAERRAGQMLAEMPKATGAQLNGGNAGGPIVVPPANDTKTLSDLGITKNESSRWQKLAGVSDESFEHAVAAAKEVAGEVTTAAMLRVAEPPKPEAEKVTIDIPAAIPDGMIQIEQDRLDELRSNLQEALDDNNSMARVFEANDKLVAALDEAKRYREQNRILESRIAGLMNEKNEAIRAAKSWQNKFLKLEKQAGLVCSTI